MPLCFRNSKFSLGLVILAVSLMSAYSAVLGQTKQPFRLGIIGLDTSHVVAFTKAFNDPNDPGYVPGARVVAAFKGGSQDVESSRSRLEKFTAELRDKWHIEIVDDISTLCKKVDGILLESVDGRPHLQQVKPVLAARKPVFIDKPLAASYRDAKEIARLAKEAGVPWFSSSSLRFWEETQRLKTSPEAGSVVGCDVYGPSPTEPHHPDLMWYGIHAVEALYTLMGRGCESVTRVTTEGTDVVVGKWKDGRLGVVRGIRQGKQDYGITLFGEKAILRSESREEGYRPLLVEIVKFFQTGVAPVDPRDTLEMFAFMEAADMSKAKGGTAVSLSQVTK
jgi:predicted dehydrogenase